jgi:hypothetical protein
MRIEGVGPQDIEMVDRDYEYDEPTCICEQYLGTEQTAYCLSCRMWTDDKELLMEEN